MKVITSPKISTAEPDQFSVDGIPRRLAIVPDNPPADNFLANDTVRPARKLQF